MDNIVDYDQCAMITYIFAYNNLNPQPLCISEVFRHHGLPDDIISDWGPQFISKFWRHMFKLLLLANSLLATIHKLMGKVNTPIRHWSNIFVV